MDLKGKEIVLGISGGIACYKALEIVRGIREAGGQVSVIMTKAAMEFIQPLTFQTLSERPVATSLFSLREESKIGHIKIVENADAMIVAPATANILGKAAHGIADDYLSTVLLACSAPLILAPAMNYKMWEHPAVQTNIALLKQRGAHIIQPDSGFLACGTFGTGRMTEPATILKTLAEIVSASARLENTGEVPLKGVNVLITAGPTRERIDAVRYLTNYSSGKMGYAIAAYCHRLGASVILVSGPTALVSPAGVRTIKVNSSEEMHQSVMQHASQSNLIIKAAAVSDYYVAEPSLQKIKKKKTLSLELKKTKDILKELGKKKTPSQFLVGFAAESQEIETYAKEKLAAKNLDLIVANNILQKDAGFDVDTNRVLLIDKSGTKMLPLLTKDQVAEQIIQTVLSHNRWQKVMSAIQKYEP